MAVPWSLEEDTLLLKMMAHTPNTKPPFSPALTPTISPGQPLPLAYNPTISPPAATPLDITQPTSLARTGVMIRDPGFWMRWRKLYHSRDTLEFGSEDGDDVKGGGFMRNEWPNKSENECEYVVIE